MISIKAINNKPEVYSKGTVLFATKESALNLKGIDNSHSNYVKSQLELEQNQIPLHHNNGTSYLIIYKDDANIEDFRKKGNDLFSSLKTNKEALVAINGSNLENDKILAFTEGLVLASYQFLKYFKEEEALKKKHCIECIECYADSKITSELKHIANIAKAVFWSRDMVNEPLNSLNATKFSEQVKEKGNEVGLNVEVFDKKKIESLKMGGLLAVNKGSIDPPTFTIAEWKPDNAINKKPYVLVGKGVMYDTGGLSLKPTPGSMDSMKSDMGGAAGVAGAMYAIALNQLSVWVIALLPATDNRPDGNAYTPGDIIKMYNGLHVEVMNTDAEGRLIMADALSYGDKYEPELIIDMATLTGSAAIAIGKEASIYMCNANSEVFSRLNTAAETTHERLVKFPFWDDYKESLKSPIADLKNLGGREAGAITAGKFLEHFTKSPYVHIDIAGTAFLTSNDSYRPKGGTGVGVRLLSEFFKIVSKA